MEIKEGKYIYCIIASNESKTFASPGIGGRGDKIYTICFNDISAMVSTSPMTKYSATRDNLLAHEKAIEEAMKEYTVLPVRFVTIAEDEQKVKRILEKEYGEFTGLLKNIEGKKELGLKAIFKEDVVYKDILERYEDIRVLKEKIAALPPQNSNYQQMEIGRMVESALQKEKEIYKDEILNSLSPLSVEVKVNKTYGDQIIINAAFLVEKHLEPGFDQKVADLDASYGHKIRFRYVGTVPPFNFVNLIIKMEKY
ncbi:GvpL/GvpF family gas vesicle protein [bacterium]|nr:GvpL/GvpF family gas vesicle protein [bacterium]MBU1753280.1 GvpL/GvpF family gas vesicle protein [bacterium]